jgi:hypothetical protein
MGEKGEQGPPGAPILLNLVHQEPTLDCGLGGIRVESGADVSQNGILDPWEVSTSAVACTPRSRARRVFVSSETYQGNLGGPAGADALCQKLADAVPELADGTFRAWISTYYSTPLSQFVRDAALGFARIDGVKIADSWLELTDGSSLLAPISVDENGHTVATGQVWTGTDWYGNVLGYGDCNYWQMADAGYYGSVGNAASTHEWTVSTAAGTYARLACSSSARIYCFEQ